MHVNKCNVAQMLAGIFTPWSDSDLGNTFSLSYYGGVEGW